MAGKPHTEGPRDPYRRCEQHRCRHDLAPGITLSELLSASTHPPTRSTRTAAPPNRR